MLSPTISVLFDTAINCVYGSSAPFLDILDIVQSCPKCPKWVISEKLRKLQSCALRNVGTHLAGTRTGIRADPDSNRRERLVAIASVALPIGSAQGHSNPARSEACGSVCSGQRDEAGKVGGRVGSQRSWGGAHNERHYTIRRRRWRACQNWVCAQNGHPGHMR
jgi:hypothetical protein